MKYIPLSKTKHLKLALSEERNYFFAGDQTLIELCNFELQEAISLAPIVFPKTDEGFKPCLLLGLEANKNLFVTPSGQWVNSFVPAVLRVFPFKSAKSKDGKKIICFQESSDLLVSEGRGKRLFNDDGSASQLLHEYMRLFSDIDASNEQTKKVCAILNDFSLLEPFKIDLKRADGVSIEIAEQWRIKAEAFQQLEDKQYLELRKSGAMPLIYAHFFSLRSYYNLVQLLAAQENSSASLRELGSKIFENEDSSLDFNF